jgi:hypothetical protein
MKRRVRVTLASRCLSLLASLRIKIGRGRQSGQFLHLTRSLPRLFFLQRGTSPSIPSPFYVPFPFVSTLHSEL